MNRRLNLEKKIDFDTFQPRIGTAWRDRPTSIYLTGKTYITPKNKEDEYSENLQKIETDLKADLRRFLAGDEFLDTHFILNFEVSENGIKYGKNSYCFFQVFFHQKSEPYLSLLSLKDKVNPKMIEILSDIKACLEDNGFEIREKRKAV